jgi:maltose O-acetyltransferase
MEATIKSRRTERPLLGWVRRFLHYRLRGHVDPKRLVRQGLRLGTGVYIAPGATIDPRHCWLISIGDESALAPGVHILAHDASTKAHLGYTKIGEVRIGRRVFVGAGTIVLPDVRIGDDAIVGAGSVVRDDVPPGMVALGNPARTICTTAEYLERHRERMRERPRFGRSEENKEAVRQAVRDGVAYVE